MDLRDLLIAMATFMVGLFVVQGIYHVLGFTVPRSSLVKIALGISAGLAIYLAVTPVIYQRLRMRPMWYPLCPTCGDKNRFWAFGTTKPDWPREMVRCFSCGTVLELWYGPVPSGSEPSEESPSFSLIWPQSFGRWRRIE
jgi:hypothetical protein